MSPISILFTPTRHRHLRHLSPFLHRHISASPSLPLHLTLSHPIYMIWGSNTSVGKTLVSAGLAASVLSNSLNRPNSAQFNYIKPVQTGFPVDSDSRFVYRKVLEVLGSRGADKLNLFASNHAVKASVDAAREVFGSEVESCEGGLRDLCWYEERRVEGKGGNGVVDRLVCKMLHGWKEAVSPHLAVERENADLGDSVLLGSLLCWGRCGSVWVLWRETKGRMFGL